MNGRRRLTSRRVAWLVATLVAVTACHALAELDLQTLAHQAGGTRVLCELTFDHPLTRADLDHLRQTQARPLQPPRTLIGQGSALFEVRARTATRLQADLLVAELTWLKQYPLAAAYSIHFEYVGDETPAELTFTIAVPRSATGRTLTALKARPDPPAQFETTTDPAGNRFLVLHYAGVAPGQMFLFDFDAAYDYDAEAIVEGSIAMLGDTPMPANWPDEVRPFLQPGFHLESDHPEIVAAAMPLSQTDRLDERVRNVLEFVGRTVTYDTPKKDGYFGGKFVYNDAWEMWQGALGTLQRGEGCCPDSAELKVALLRACGIPARTAVHNGHLYAEVWVPERGWLTDAPMTKIPVIRSPGPDNTSYMAWEPAVPVRCAGWSGRLTPFGESAGEGEGWIELPVE